MPHAASAPESRRVREPGSGGDVKFRVVIVGGGVAGIEAALCLHDLAGDRVSTTMLAPTADFVYVPADVHEPFVHPVARRHPLAEIAKHAGAELRRDALAWLDGDFGVVHTVSGEQLQYDALLLAPGASMYANYASAMTLDPYRIDEQLRQIREDIDGGEVQTLAFVIPDGPVWPLPIYELALVTAMHAKESAADVQITIVTPEIAPLAVFGPPVADRVAQLLAQSKITTVLSTISAVRVPGLIALHPGHGMYADPMQPQRQLSVDRIISLPQLFGPHCPGVPTSAHRGFISTDAQQRVQRLDGVYAVGDATHFPIKFGGIAAQQADVAAQTIAALAGANVPAVTFRPELHAVLLTAGQPLMLDAHPSGSTATYSQVTELEGPISRGKIDARYLTPYLEELDRRPHELATI